MACFQKLLKLLKIVPGQMDTLLFQQMNHVKSFGIAEKVVYLNTNTIVFRQKLRFFRGQKLALLGLE